MENPLLAQILLQVVLIALNAVFACAEIAVISMNDNKLAQMAARGDKRAVRLARLTSQPARFLATIQVAITLSGFMGSAFAADSFSDILVGWMAGWGLPLPLATLDAIALVVITLILSYFTLVFGELVPKRLAMKKAESLALAMATMISVVAKLTAPLVWVLTASTNCVLRLFRIDPNAEEEPVSEEEIRMMVDIGTQKGVIEDEEKRMIQNVFDLNDLPVHDFVTHRTDVDLLWMDDTPEQWAETIHQSRHSLYPVCEGSVDNVVGILYAKDYFRLRDCSREQLLEQAVRPAYFVPESICADALLRQMKLRHNHMAVVLDEYGGVLGIVTLFDLLEQLVGDMEDEPVEGQRPDIERLPEGGWRVYGGADLEEVSEQLDAVLPTETYDTFSGYVLGSYGLVPEDGSSFELEAGSLRICVTEMKDHRVETALVYPVVAGNTPQEAVL